MSDRSGALNPAHAVHPGATVGRIENRWRASRPTNEGRERVDGPGVASSGWTVEPSSSNPPGATNSYLVVLC